MTRRHGLGLAVALFIGALTAPLQAFATDYDIQICRIQANSSGVLLLRPCGTWLSKNGCANSWIGIPHLSAGEQSMYSTALSAFSMNKTVRVRMDGVSCQSNYDATSMVRIKQ